VRSGQWNAMVIVRGLQGSGEGESRRGKKGDRATCSRTHLERRCTPEYPAVGLVPTAPLQSHENDTFCSAHVGLGV